MNSKKRLGRGLGALLPDKSAEIEVAENDSKEQKRLCDLLVSKIEANPFQPRLEFDQTTLDELKQSISSKGIIQPVSVRKIENGKYQLVAGERRLRAVRELKFEKIPAYIMKVESDEDMLEMALIENVQREYLNPIELALSFQRLITECKLTQEDVAKKIGKDRTTITNFLRLLKLPNNIQASIRKGEIMMGHARALLSLPENNLMLKTWKKTVKNAFSVRQVEKTVKSLLKEIQEKKDKKEQNQDLSRKKTPYIQKFEGSLREKLGTKVKIRTKRDGGSIEIEYYSKEDLSRLMEIFDEIKTF